MAHFYSTHTGKCTCGRLWIQGRCASRTRMNQIGTERWFEVYDPRVNGFWMESNFFVVLTK